MDWHTRWRIASYVLLEARTLWHVVIRVGDELLGDIVGKSKEQGHYFSHHMDRDGRGLPLLFLAEHELSSVTAYGDRGEAIAELRLSAVEGNRVDFALDMDLRYINRGIGTKLMEWAFQALSGLYPMGIELGGTVSTHNPETEDDQRRLHFYTKLGFQVVERKSLSYYIKRTISLSESPPYDAPQARDE